MGHPTNHIILLFGIAGAACNPEIKDETGGTRTSLPAEQTSGDGTTGTGWDNGGGAEGTTSDGSTGSATGNSTGTASTSPVAPTAGPATVIRREMNGTQYHIVHPARPGSGTTILLWGYATGVGDSMPTIYDKMFRFLAGYDYLVIAPEVKNTGRGEKLTEALEVIRREFPTVPRTGVGIFGHSQGGGTAIRMGSSPAIGAVVAIQPDCWNHVPLQNCRNGMKKPTLYLSGGKDVLVPACTVYDLNGFHQTTGGPSRYIEMPEADHISWMGGGAVHDETAMHVLNWFNLHLRGISGEPAPITPTRADAIGGSIKAGTGVLTTLMETMLTISGTPVAGPDSPCTPEQYEVLADISSRYHGGGKPAGAD